MSKARQKRRNVLELSHKSSSILRPKPVNKTTHAIDSAEPATLRVGRIGLQVLANSLQMIVDVLDAVDGNALRRGQDRNGCDEGRPLTAVLV